MNWYVITPETLKAIRVIANDGEVILFNMEHANILKELKNKTMTLAIANRMAKHLFYFNAQDDFSEYQLNQMGKV